MAIFLIYAAILGFFWLKTLVSTSHSDDDRVVGCFLEQKYTKIMYYKQYGVIYIVTLVYCVSISMLSASYISSDKQSPDGLFNVQHAWQLIVGFPIWLQFLFFIGLVLLCLMFGLPIIRFIRDKKAGV